MSRLVVIVSRKGNPCPSVSEYPILRAMGSPISPVLADLVMEEIEETAMSTAPHAPKWWFRYVDDSHTCLKRDHVNEFHRHLNSINPNI